MIALLLSLLIGGSNAPISRAINPETLTGKISLTLKNGVWKLWEEKPVYQNITLDLICDRGNCQPDAWAYAPKFNQDVDHQGTVKVIQLENVWQINAKMKIQFHPWHPETEEANYTLEIVPYKGKLFGSYSGKFNHQSLQGSVTGTINSQVPQAIANHQPIRPREHPRLIFRQSQLPALREKLKTPAGQAILAQLQKTLKDPVYDDGYVPNGGYHATGYCLLSLLNQDQQAAETAWKLVDTSMQGRGRRILEQSPIVAGVALAYDLCYSAWDEERIKKVTRWLGNQADLLLKGYSSKNGWNNTPWSNWNGRARGAAGLAALAVLDEPKTFFGKPTDPQRLYQLAARNIGRYLAMAIGDHGWGTEGDHYTTEPLVLTIFPFLQAYQNVVGEDFGQDSHANWILPYYLTRTVVSNGKLGIAAYGRHRYYPGGTLFTMGLGTTPRQFLPGIFWFFDRYLGMEGDKSFGINSPQEAAFALAGYQENIVRKNPEEISDRVLVDQQKGFYVFRDRWQDENDFVASIHLKQQPLGQSWSSADVGSFRIWGLGGRWANPGTSKGGGKDENAIVMPKARPWRSSQPVFFQSQANGSGIVSLLTNSLWRKNSKPPISIKLLRSFAVDYSGASGAPGLFVVVDKFIGAVDAREFQDKTWVMNTEGTVKIAGQSFIIEATNGATMRGTFITPDPVQISVQKSKTENRILATGGNDFFVIMTVQQGKAPDIKVSGTGLDTQVQIGKQTIYFQKDRIALSKF